MPLAQGAGTASVSNSGLNVNVYPLYAPDINDEKDCTEGAIGVSKVDGTSFSERDTFELSGTFPENNNALITFIQNGHRGNDGFASVSRTKFVLALPYTKEFPKLVTLRIKLCSSDLVISKIYQVPKLINVKIVYFRNYLTPAATITVPVEILPRDFEANLISELRKECGQDSIMKKFVYNMTLEQSGIPRKDGDKVKIAGTLFRHGFPTPNDEITLLLESEKYADPREFVAKTMTDEKGQFVFSFPIKKKKSSKTSIYVIIAQNRAEPIGPIPGPFDEYSYQVVFYWEPTARYFPGPRDWVPQHTQVCKEKVDAYNKLVATSQTNIFEDDRNRFAWFTAKSIYYGFKNKKSYLSTSDWDVKTGGRCFVNGYTTKSGKRVSGYFRSCP